MNSDREPVNSVQTSSKNAPPEIRNLRRLAGVLDSSIPLPGGFRTGIDGLIGLIPVVGDAVGGLISSYIVLQSARLGVSTRHLVRMMFNILLEILIGAIPILGDLFDIGWKANVRNVAVAEKHLPVTPPSSSPQRRLSVAVALLFAGFLTAIIFLVYLSAVVFMFLFRLIFG